MRGNIFITGFMGTGKSTVASALAKRECKIMMDMDQMIEDRVGKSITEIFNHEGEEYFRRIERQVLKEIACKNNLVIATGGGALLDEENYQLALKRGTIILLHASPQVIFNRLQAENSRPLLAGNNKFEKIRELMDKRKKGYSRFKHCIDTSCLNVNQVVDQIIQICRREDHENHTSKI